MTEEIPEDLKSISDTKQVEVEPSKVSSSVLGLQWTVTEDSLQVCRGTGKEDETQRKILSLVSSVFDPLGAVCTIQCSNETTPEMHLDKKWANLGQIIKT